jgi:hypothetical protein
MILIDFRIGWLINLILNYVPSPLLSNHDDSRSSPPQLRSLLDAALS